MVYLKDKKGKKEEYMKYTIILLLILSSILFAENKFEDLNEEHWAYPEVQALIDKGIIVENRYKFDGSEPMSRYEFAFNLSRALDYVDLKKANKEDLNILESLMFEFSQELNKIGFDSSTFINRIDAINETIDLLRERVNENERTISDLKKRVEALEDKN